VYFGYYRDKRKLSVSCAFSLTFGFGTLTQFTDANKSIVIEDSLFVLSTFNRIEVRNIASIVNGII
jgi:hypothetical protein